MSIDPNDSPSHAPALSLNRKALEAAARAQYDRKAIEHSRQGYDPMIAFDDVPDPRPLSEGSVPFADASWSVKLHAR